MLVQGLPVSPEGLASSRTAPHYSLLEILWLLTFPNVHLKVPLLPFPRVTCVQSLAQASVPDADLGARVLL